MKQSAALLLAVALVAAVTSGCSTSGQQEAAVSQTSTQPAPTSTVAEVPTIVIPDLVGQTSEYARGVLDVLGLTFYVEESLGVSGEPGVVVAVRHGITVTVMAQRVVLNCVHRGSLALLGSGAGTKRRGHRPN